MPGKSRPGRTRRSTRRKKGLGTAATVTQQREAAGEPAAAAATSLPRTTDSVVRSTSTRYPHIVGELRRIGILAGIMLIILVVLALVLS